MLLRDGDSIKLRTERLALGLDHHDSEGRATITEATERIMRGLEAEAELRFNETGEMHPADLSMQLVGLEGQRVVVKDWVSSPPRIFTVGMTTGHLPRHTEGLSERAPECRLEYHSVEVIG